MPVDSGADKQARAIESQMTNAERLSLVVSVIGVTTEMPTHDKRIPPDMAMSVGYVPGVPRLGVPALRMSDASLGITNPGYRPGDTATALPAALATGASFNPVLAREAGRMLGREARERGFNVLLGGGMNLVRDPRNGRNFEYLSEDPWHSAVLAAEAVAGTQAEGVISTVKHFSLNCNETNRHWLDAVIDPDAHRESDLLAFQIAIERAQPGAVMSGYNKINGVYAGDNQLLLNDILKDAWGYAGWVMSDWGGTTGWECALHGLDQESGAQIDTMMWGQEWFTHTLQTAYQEGRLPRERLSDMVRRILRSIYAVGADTWGPTPAVDMDLHHHIALETARQGIVLLKNNGILPIPAESAARIAVIGGYAHLGVLTGTGSSAVVPPGGYAASINLGGPGIMGSARSLFLLPSSPLDELRKLLPDATIEYDPGTNPADAAALARRSDIVVVFGIRVESEGFDLPDLALPWGQDSVIEAIAAANPETVVVLENGSPIAMPWLDEVAGVVEAWYPGQAGGLAIAEMLTGVINPSGRLPITFPADLRDTPRPDLSGLGAPWGTPTTISYREGSDVGYRWYAKTGAKPLFPFGYGLTYTSFAYTDAEVSGGDTVTMNVTVTNTGAREGADVPQLYLTGVAEKALFRLMGFARVQLAPGQSQRVELTADPRLLAHFDGGAGQWRIADGAYRVALGRSTTDLEAHAQVQVRGRLFGD
ncbi:glycoside hydrolase family 3 protein [Streptomyces sp. NRRL B-24484]|uniref:glycoside hydrolase family 3 protein n=1 Tax=Streptomyces sp. NRRL B-24484 TaxID=1463833 RepID=UPI0018FFB8E4|nr:glycoside hydrolase family 3 C-terminal domain-containing protein [Streptomyces sp. NRRL B-24484]